MKYKIVKPDYDGRMFTHHVVLPDGYYRIFNLTRHNHENLESLIRKGYEVDEYTGPLAAGLYEEDSELRVDPYSVLQHASPATSGMPVRYIDQEAPDDSETLGLRPRQFRQQKRQRMSPEQERGNRIDDLRNTLAAMKVGYRANDSRAVLEAKLQKAIAKGDQ
jgi:hypothetical protein